MLNKLVFLSALSVVALSGAAQAATFNPGTYTAVSKGNGGEVPGHGDLYQECDRISQDRCKQRNTGNRFYCHRKTS